MFMDNLPWLWLDIISSRGSSSEQLNGIFSEHLRSMEFWELFYVFDLNELV